MFRVLCVFALLLCVAVPCIADVSGGVDVAEVLRRGDLVEHVDGYQSGPESAVCEAMEPPASDADKWFVSVLTSPSCSPCKQLLKTWETDEWLLALADPNDSKASWSHFAVFDSTDRSQAFRFEALKVKAYPTIVVQPPRSGKYGDPSTVVYQGVYGGDTRKLAEAMSASIRSYVERVSEAQRNNSWQQAPWQPRDDTSEEGSEDGRKPLFPRLNPLSGIDVPPIEVQFPSIPWTGIITSLLAGAWPVALVLAVIAAVKIWRWWRLSRGEKLLIDNAIFDKLIDRLEERFAPQQEEPEPKASAKTTRKK